MTQHADIAGSPSPGPTSPGTSPVEVARTEEEIEANRWWWDEVDVANVDADPDHLLTVVRNDRAVVRPHVIRLTVEGQPPVLVVARVVDQRFVVGVGKARLGSIPSRALVISFDGVVGATSKNQREAVCQALGEALASREADVVVLQKVDRTSTWFAHLHGARSGALLVERPTVTWWFTDLPDSWQALLDRRSSKSRRQIRYDDNKLRRAYADRLVVRRLDLPEHAERMLDDLRAVAATSYQRGLGVSLFDGTTQEAVLRRAAELGRLRVWMLYVDEAPVAFWWGVAHRGTLTIGSPGFDPARAKDRVGYFTFRRMLEDVSDDPTITRLDYGPGDADYKERFATERVEVSDVLLGARRARPLLTLTTLRLHDRVDALARRSLERGGRAEQLRRWWRSRNVAATGGDSRAS